MPNTAHRFHIELEGIDPPIWRRIRVPSSYSFWDLHVAIQDAMGWLRHDWVHRIRAAFEILGLTPTEQMQARTLRLDRIASQA
jgi:hypothetical protein